MLSSFPLFIHWMQLFWPIWFSCERFPFTGNGNCWGTKKYRSKNGIISIFSYFGERWQYREIGENSTRIDVVHMRPISVTFDFSLPNQQHNKPHIPMSKRHLYFVTWPNQRIICVVTLSPFSFFLSIVYVQIVTWNMLQNKMKKKR